jgi:hypothetical protein
MTPILCYAQPSILALQLEGHERRVIERRQHVHTFAISAHAVSGIVAFFVGLALILQTDFGHKIGLAWALLVFLVLLEIFMLTAIVLDWPSLPVISRPDFGALATRA